MANLYFIDDDPTLVEQISNFIHEWNNEEIDEFMIQTSGSTGNPQKLILKKDKMKNSALMSGAYFGFSKNQNILMCLSPNSIGGKMLLIRALLFDMNIWIKKASKNPLNNLHQVIDFVSLVPYQLEHILETNPDQIFKLKTILLGGSQVSNDLEKRMNNFPHVQVFESFGMTETISHFALRKVSPINDSFFTAIGDVQIRVNENNQLIVSSEKLGVQNLLTNDIVELIDNQKFIWKGRADFVINSGGLKFFPETIEKKISGLIPNRYFIASEKDSFLGEKIILVIESNSEFQILELLKKHLDKYEIPKKVYFINQFVETKTNKINRLETLKRIHCD